MDEQDTEIISHCFMTFDHMPDKGHTDLHFMAQSQVILWDNESI